MVFFDESHLIGFLLRLPRKSPIAGRCQVSLQTFDGAHGGLDTFSVNNLPPRAICHRTRAMPKESNRLGFKTHSLIKSAFRRWRILCLNPKGAMRNSQIRWMRWTDLDKQWHQKSWLKIGLMKLFGLCKDPVKIYIGFLGPAPKIFFLHLEKHHLRECREETRPLVSHDVSKCEHSKHFLEDMLTLLRVRHRWLGGTLSLLSLPFKRWSSAKTACAYPRWPTSARLILQLLWRSWKEHTTEDFGLTISHISCIFMLWFWNL